jgi:hypothetical protein
LDWENRVVDIYINETFKGTANFYHEEVTTVDTVLIYNLNPETTSWWKNIEVCNKKCPSNILKYYEIRFHLLASPLSLYGYFSYSK